MNSTYEIELYMQMAHMNIADLSQISLVTYILPYRITLLTKLYTPLGLLLSIARSCI